MLLTGSFVAGLLTVAVATFMPGSAGRSGAGNRTREETAATSLRPGTGMGSARGGPLRELLPYRLAIVVDDCGYDPTMDAEWLKFPEPVTLAVIPFGPSSRRLAQAAHARGFGVLIHVPMEPEGSVSDRTDGFRFRVGMGADVMGALLDRMIAENPWADGVSNYMGSAFTADPHSMAVFASLLRTRGLFFLDSVTSTRSVAVRTAREAGVPVARRDVDLRAGTAPEEMRREWKETLALVKEKGTAILLCHGGRESLRVILDLVPDLKKEGIRAVTVDNLLVADGSG